MFGLADLVAFGVMTAIHLEILHRILLGISTKIKMVIFGLIHKVLMTEDGHFLVMMKSHYLIVYSLIVC